MRILIYIFIPWLLFALQGSHAQYTEYNVRKLSNDQFGFTEGPAWDGYNLYFSDIPAGNIYQYNSDDGFLLFLDNPFSTNGIAYREGVLYVCESGTGRVISVDTFGNYLDILADNYQGEFLNSPNDLALDEKDGIYFTDPAFGFEPLITESVYYIDPGGELKRIITGLTKPNGIIYNSEQERIYVSDTYDKFIYSYQLDSPGVISDTFRFAELRLADFREDNYSGADGMCFDKNGFLYVSTEIGIQVFDSLGNEKGIIEIPETPTNCIFGGKNYDELYVTAQKNVYRVRLNLDQSTGSIENAGKRDKFRIDYNPGNSHFMVKGITGKFRLLIYDVSGKILYSDMYNTGETINFNAENGIYFITLYNSTEYYSCKIFISE